jgi:hypothetical protein
LNWLVIKAYVKLPELCSLWECDDIFWHWCWDVLYGYKRWVHSSNA